MTVRVAQAYSVRNLAGLRCTECRGVHAWFSRGCRPLAFRWKLAWKLALEHAGEVVGAVPGAVPFEQVAA